VNFSGRFLAPLVAMSVMLAAVPTRSAAQSPSASERGAWDALMLSPFGALPPLARLDPPSGARLTEISVRYGHWQYGADDASHDNFGVTASRRLATGNTTASMTVGYLAIACRCQGWMLAGAEVQTTPFQFSGLAIRNRATNASVGVRLNAGMGRERGVPATTGSVALSAPMTVEVTAVPAMRIAASVVPGAGYGRISDPTAVEAGVRPTFGAALAFEFRSGFNVDLGMQRVIISGGPMQVGVGLSWALGRRAPATVPGT